MEERFYSFNRYLREIFGERVQRISINAGFSCPNLDGKLSRQGCLYCSNQGFGVYAASAQPVEEQIEESIAFYAKRLGVKKFIVYFQSFTNTYADLGVLEKKYAIIKKYPQIVGLFIATRPDCVDRAKLELIAGYQKDYLVWIEYGLQTTHNRLLKAINRNHTYESFLAALALTREHKINVGVHLIFGLPGASFEDSLEDARRLRELDIQGFKFHILHVLQGTALSRIYETEKFKLLGWQEYINITCDFLEQIPASRVILRLVSDAAAAELIAPLWINNKSQVIEGIRNELKLRGTGQGYYCRQK